MKFLLINKYKSLTMYNICFILGLTIFIPYIHNESYTYRYISMFFYLTILFFLLCICLIAFLIEKKTYKIKNIEIKNPKANEIFTKACLITSFIVFLVYLAIGYDLHRISMTID